MLGVPACSMSPRVDAGKLTFAVEGSSRSEMTASDPKETFAARKSGHSGGLKQAVLPSVPWRRYTDTAEKD